MPNNNIEGLATGMAGEIDPILHGPSEETVEYNGKTFRKRDTVEDWLTGNLIPRFEDEITSLYTAINFNEEAGVLELKKEFLERNNFENSNIFGVILHVDHSRRGDYSRVYFKSREEAMAFIGKYDYVPSTSRVGVYLVSRYREFLDKQHPEQFNFTKVKQLPEELFDISLPKNYKNSKEYKDLLDHCFKTNESNGIESKTFLSFEGLKHSFGVELETIDGNFNNIHNLSLISDLNVAGVFDGSLRDADGSGPWGLEYVTGVLKGDSGLKQLNKITKVLTKKCAVDKRCSVHVHIGSLKWNSEEIAHAYMLGTLLEDEIFSMMPQSRDNNPYCRRIPKLKPGVLRAVKKKPYKEYVSEVYNYVFKVVTEGMRPSIEYNKKSVHPRGRHGGWDRNRDHRYSWLNFTNIIFNQRGSFDSKTIEFRAHSGTLSYKKVHNWIKICMAFVEFVHTNKRRIRSAVANGETITLKEIISSVYPKTGDRLIEYVEIRKIIFSKNLNQSVDYINEDCNIKSIKEIICV